MSTVERVSIGAAIPQVFIDGPVDMTWVRDWILRSEALGFDSIWVQPAVGSIHLSCAGDRSQLYKRSVTSSRRL